MITDRVDLARYLGQEVTCAATFTRSQRQILNHPPLHMILHVRMRHRDIYTNHLWVVLPKETEVVPGQRFLFRGVVIPYLRRDDMSDSVTISRIEILRELT